MYQLYKTEKTYGALLMALSVLIMILNISELAKQIKYQMFKSDDVVVFIAFSLIVIIFLKISLNLLFSYKSINSLKKVNPSLVKEYEQDFDLSKRLGEEIWIGNNYIFFRTVNEFCVLPFSEIKKIKLYSFSGKGRLRYNLEVEAISKKLTVLIISGLENKEAAVKSTNILADVTNAETIISI